MQQPNIPNNRRILEIAAVLLTAIGKFIFINYLDWRLPFIAVAIIAWVTYIIYRSKTDPGILHYWGFRTDNFMRALKMVLPFGILAIIAFIAIGLYNDTIAITWHILPILILYPLWGTVQQFLLISLTAGNLADMKGLNMNKGLIILLTAILFAGVHYPFIWLIAGTFLLALFYGWVFLKERNIYVLGLFHGWLAALFYYTVLERDPFLEIFGQWISS